jgi:hypothetical protein
MIYQLVKDDVGVDLQATLTRANDGSVIDCSGATVTLKVRAKGKTTNLFTVTAGDSGTNLQNGIAIFSFVSGNLDQPEGYYEGEISIVFSDNSIETVFETIEMYIREDFA